NVERNTTTSTRQGIGRCCRSLVLVIRGRLDRRDNEATPFLPGSHAPVGPAPAQAWLRSGSSPLRWWPQSPGSYYHPLYVFPPRSSSGVRISLSLCIGHRRTGARREEIRRFHPDPGHCRRLHGLVSSEHARNGIRPPSRVHRQRSVTG